MRTRFLAIGIVAVVGGLVHFACVADEPATLNTPDTDGGAADAQACTTSATCPATAPTCSAGTCTACTPTSSDCAKFSATPVCGPTGACVACVPTSDGGSVSTDCANTPATPFCGPNDTCVACLTANDCTPQVCGSDNACRACQKNSECPAGACGDDGNCVAASMIAYVDNGGVPAATCALREPINGNTIASAYCDIADALGKKPYIVVLGRGPTSPYSPFTVNLGASAVTIIGPAASGAGAAVIGGSKPPVADTVGAGSANIVVSAPAAAPGVTIDGFEITNTTSSDGLYCNASGADHALRVRNSYIHDLQGDGLYNASCDLTFEDSKVSATNIRAIEDFNNVGVVPKYVIQRNVFINGNADGVYVGAGSSGADLTFDRNIVANYNLGNGLQLQGNGPYRITNSFFYLNQYGVDFAGGTAPVEIFQFNTVVYNTTSAVGFCDANLVVESSIVRNNGDAPNSLAHCKSAHAVSDDAGAPAFVNSSDPSNYDFHLAVDTPIHTAANTACCIDKVPTTYDAGAPLSDHDYDGTSRPMGAGYDIGAHEAK